MKQITAQQFANIFGMYVAKNGETGNTCAHETKPTKRLSCWISHDLYSKTTVITNLISNSDSLDCNVLIEPQEEFLNLGYNKCTKPDAECHARRQDGICMNGIICKPAEPSLVPFDENYAPEGCKAVEEKSGWVACIKCAFSGTTKCNDTTFLCLGNNRPDRTDVYFVKKEDEK